MGTQTYFCRIIYPCYNLAMARITRAVAVRYIEMDPERAGLAKKPWDYKWSSVAASYER